MTIDLGFAQHVIVKISIANRTGRRFVPERCFPWLNSSTVMIHPELGRRILGKQMVRWNVQNSGLFFFSGARFIALEYNQNLTETLSKSYPPTPSSKEAPY
jgi:hypothetical protein